MYLHSMSAMMSRASSCTDTSSCLAMALVRRPVIFLQTLAARAEPEGKTRHTDGLNLTVRTGTLCPYQRKSQNEVVLGRLPLDAGGSSPITVFRPMLEMSRSCSLSDSMFVHSVSTIVSTWYSLTLLTSGPKLRNKITDILSTAWKRNVYVYA